MLDSINNKRKKQITAFALAIIGFVSIKSEVNPIQKRYKENIIHEQVYSNEENRVWKLLEPVTLDDKTIGYKVPKGYSVCNLLTDCYDKNIVNKIKEENDYYIVKLNDEISDGYVALEDAYYYHQVIKYNSIFCDNKDQTKLLVKENHGYSLPNNFILYTPYLEYQNKEFETTLRDNKIIYELTDEEANMYVGVSQELYDGLKQMDFYDEYIKETYAFKDYESRNSLIKKLIMK